jgi:hypothetical protein
MERDLISLNTLREGAPYFDLGFAALFAALLATDGAQNT